LALGRTEDARPLLVENVPKMKDHAAARAPDRERALAALAELTARPTRKRGS
jgi:hypothetical protein